jgi:putative addiction module killer protein
MFEVLKTVEFENWLDGLRDRNARARAFTRIDRMKLGNFGDVKSVGGGVSEARIDYGPGYRLYFKINGNVLIVLLVGGTKASQDGDIKTAQQLSKFYV